MVYVIVNVDVVLVGRVPLTVIRAARSDGRSSVTRLTVRFAPALRHVPLRFGWPLPLSLSVGARQKFGTGPELSNFMPIAS